MTDPGLALRTLLQGTTTGSRFAANSRYTAIGTATWSLPDGRPVAYLRRRFVPQPEDLAVVQEHTVVEGDRLDNLAALYLGDPELFWRLCDANAAIRPRALTETVGATLRIALPQGLSGPTHA
jgi:hypothetical protein